jgi:hypothetical protein
MAHANIPRGDERPEGLYGRVFANNAAASREQARETRTLF